MRIGIDGYNLALPNGTGVATYGASLARILADASHQIIGIFGLNAGKAPAIRETLFFEQFGNGVSYHHLRRLLAREIITAPASATLHNIPLTDKVERRDFGPRWPAFNELWTRPLLFEAAVARFNSMHVMTTVHMKNPPDIMHWTYPVPLRMAGSRNIYTLHDLVPLKLPHTTLDNKTRYHRLIARLLAEGDHILTVSEASRRDILGIFSPDPDQISNAYQASPLPNNVAMANPTNDQAMIERVFGLPSRGFYLFFGASDPKKNIGRIVDAYLASGSERPLVVVSSRDWGMSGASGGLGKDGTVYGRKTDRPIVQLQYLPRDMLFRLIRSARAVLFPSLYEGFGLPALEAIQLGTPVIGSNTASLPEVVGPGGLLVDPYDTNAITEAIRAIDRDDGLIEQLGAAGMVHAAQFSSQAFLARLSEVYSKLGHKL